MSGSAAALPLSRRRRGRWAALLLVAACDGPSEPKPTPPGSGLGGDRLPDTVALAALVDTIVTGIPGRNSNGYRPPNAVERQEMLAALRLALERRVAGADSLADRYGYDVEPAMEAATGDPLVLFVERRPVRRGWGTFVWNRSPLAAPVDVHVNHPLFDRHTPEIGADLFLKCRCRWLLMAGTHRYANPNEEADMARATSSVFQAFHETLAGSTARAISVHGFARGGYALPVSRADVVLSAGRTSTGELRAPPVIVELRDRMLTAGWTAGVAGADPGYEQLSGGTNPQGRFSNDRYGHGRWVHLEIAAEVRDLPATWRRLNDTLAQWAQRSATFEVRRAE